MIIPVTFIYSEDKIDPIYEMLGLQIDADKVEILEDGYIDTDQIEAVAGSMGFTQVYTKGGHVFEIEMETEDFIALWT